MNSEAFCQTDTAHEAESTEHSGSKVMQTEFRIGEWLVKPQLNQLQHTEDGESRHLEPRLAKLLCYLAAHAGEVVDRDILVSVLWPKVIVNENSLTRAVSELRKQLSHTDSQKTVYIETIPKRGYRLSIPVGPAPTMQPDSVDIADELSFLRTLPYLNEAKQSVTAALCLSLVLGTWLQLQPSSGPADDTSTQWADELVLTDVGAELRDEVILSSSELSGLKGDSITPPVLSLDESQFAYIQYDHTGSTLYLGQVSGEFEPVPVFNSTDVLYNLAWSPIGNAVLFASKPALTTAWFDNEATAKSDLYSFDLDSFRLSKLVEKSPFQQSQSDENGLSLT